MARYDRGTEWDGGGEGLERLLSIQSQWSGLTEAGFYGVVWEH